MNLKEVYRLKGMLTAQGIPFEEADVFGGKQLLYPAKEGRKCSIICHLSSHGREEGLLEIMGLLTPEEAEYDDVVGYLTAEDVFARIQQDWAATKG